MKITKILIVLLCVHWFNIGFGQEMHKEKIPVLNFATFHLSNSNDAIFSPVDINNPDVKRDIEKIVKKLVEFKPTIICVEVPVKSSEGINEIYQKYKIDQSNTTNWSEEINSIAFEVGRVSSVENIYGIDSKLGFNYPLLMEMAAESKSLKNYINQYVKSIEEINNKSILEKFSEYNSGNYKSKTIDFYNTLAVMHTAGNYEGAEIISDFYKRNLRIFSNLNDVPKSNGDRILVILGGTHSAYLDFFMRDHPTYELIDIEDYIVQ